MSLDTLSRAAGILLEVFVNPLNLVAPSGLVRAWSCRCCSSCRRRLAGAAILAGLLDTGLADRPGHGRLGDQAIPVPRALDPRAGPGVLSLDRRWHRMGSRAGSRPSQARLQSRPGPAPRLSLCRVGLQDRRRPLAGFQLSWRLTQKFIYRHDDLGGTGRRLTRAGSTRSWTGGARTERIGHEQ